jgi:ribosomal RNA assembly protein
MSDPKNDAAAEPDVPKNKRFRKDKPWDTDDIDQCVSPPPR